MNTKSTRMARRHYKWQRLVSTSGYETRTKQSLIDICLNCDAKTCRGDCPKVNGRGENGKTD